MQNILTLGKQTKFKNLSWITKSVDKKDLLQVILLYNVRYIASVLKISDSMTYYYTNDYLRQNKIAHSSRGGSDSNLTVIQELEVIGYFHITTYSISKAFCAYAFNKYPIEYTVFGITKWLEANDFVYKPPLLISRKLSEYAPPQFVAYYHSSKRPIILGV